MQADSWPEARVIIEMAPGDEAQVDYGEGPMVRDPHTGKYRRTCPFVLTPGFSRNSVLPLVFRSSSQTWAELHEKAFRHRDDLIARDNYHDWVLANENMAKVLAAKGYHYQFVFARNAGHTDRAVKAQTLPEALEYVWQGYPVKEPR